MYERAEFAKEIGSDHHHDRPDRRLHGDAVDVEVGAAQRRDPAPAPCRPRTYTRQKTHGVSFRVLAKWCRMHRRRPHPRRHRRRQARGRPDHDQGLLRHAARWTTCRRTRSTGIYFDQDWASLAPVMPVASGGIHAGQMHQLLHLPRRGRGPAVRRRHDRPPDGHRRRRDRQPRCRRGDDPGPQRGPRLLPRRSGHPREGGQGLPAS